MSEKEADKKAEKAAEEDIIVVFNWENKANTKSSWEESITYPIGNLTGFYIGIRGDEKNKESEDYEE